MKTFYYPQLCGFTVQGRDERTGATQEDLIVFTKDQLRAAQIVGESSKELIYRAYNRKGFTVLDIGKARKVTAELDLEGLFREAVGE